MNTNHRGTEAQRNSILSRCADGVPRPATHNARDARDPLTAAVIGAAIEVHQALGPGLLESAYEACLCRELELRSIAFDRQVPLSVSYKGVALELGYRMDLVVERSLVVEIKTAECLAPIHEAQLLTYLRLSGLRTGLLLNFHVPFLRDGIKRMVL